MKTLTTLKPSSTIRRAKAPSPRELSDKQSRLRRAADLVRSYHLVISPGEKGNHVGRMIELPGVTATGSTFEECVRCTLLTAEAVVGSMLEDGVIVPTSKAIQRRTEQVNIRLTEEEKMLLAGEARRRGLKGLSDVIRVLAMSACTT